MADHPGLDAQISETRARLEANLTELRDRARHTRAVLSPSTYLENVWLMVGVGVAIGYLFGRPRPRRGY